MTGSSGGRGASAGTIQVALAVHTARSCGSHPGSRCQPGPSANPKSVTAMPDLAQPVGVLGGEGGAPDDAVRGRGDERGRPASEPHGTPGRLDRAGVSPAGSTNETAMPGRRGTAVIVTSAPALDRP